MDDAIETKVKNCQACIVDQPLKKYTPLRPTPLPRGPWVKGVLDLVVQLMENPFCLVSIMIHPTDPQSYILQEVTSREVSKRRQIYSLELGFQRKSFLVTDNSL